jgi:chromosome segregation ATPase
MDGSFSLDAFTRHLGSAGRIGNAAETEATSLPRADSAVGLQAKLAQAYGCLRVAEAALKARSQELLEVQEDRVRLAGKLASLKAAARFLLETTTQARNQCEEARQNAKKLMAEAARFDELQKAAKEALVEMENKARDELNELRTANQLMQQAVAETREVAEQAQAEARKADKQVASLEEQLSAADARERKLRTRGLWARICNLDV